jgi:antitoxin YefM
VEVIILVKPSASDETDYLLSNPENRQDLLEAINRVENREDVVAISPQEWYEKYSL